MTYLAQDYQNIPAVLNVMWAARALERMGDRCQNIAEYVIYLVLGKDVRHSSLDEVMAELEARAASDAAATSERRLGAQTAAGGDS
jgi:phosphate transport system protein